MRTQCEFNTKLLVRVNAFQELQIMRAIRWAIGTKGKFPAIMEALLEYIEYIVFITPNM
jgi:hypothetical protein